ncbi:MAG: hypothetical protein GY810_10610 [Aureispira sp.]|nr:hypothetical protein [Aureispira sp.]
MTLSKSELASLSQLLLSEGTKNIEIGLKILTSNLDAIEVVHPELMLLYIVYETTEEDDESYLADIAKKLLEDHYSPKWFDSKFEQLRALSTARWYDDYMPQQAEPIIIGELPTYEEVRAIYEPLILTNEIYQDWYFELGYACKVHQQYKRAISYWKPFFEQKIPHRDILFEYGYTLTKVGEYAAAKAVQQYLEEMFPNDPFLKNIMRKP